MKATITDLLVEDVIAALQERYGYTYRYAENMVYHGGLRIYSAEDPEQQKLVEDIFADEDNFPASLEGDEEDPQSAIYIMDYTGRTVATVGARGEKTANRVLNRATQSTRQPGFGDEADWGLRSRDSDEYRAFLLAGA